MIKTELVVVFIFIAGLAQAGANPWEEIVRNTPVEMRGKGTSTAADCEEERKYFHQQGCVKAEHLEYLRSEKACPSCNRHNEPKSVTFEGCFAHGMRLWAQNKQTGDSSLIPVEVLIADPASYSIWALSQHSTLDAMELELRDVVRPIKGPEHDSLIVIEANEHVLALTAGHPVLLANGSMIKASQLKEGDELLDGQGHPIQIDAIRHETTQQDVYNLMTSGGENVEHIILAEGILVGDRMWQNQMPSGDEILQVF